MKSVLFTCRTIRQTPKVVYMFTPKEAVDRTKKKHIDSIATPRDRSDIYLFHSPIYPSTELRGDRQLALANLLFS